MSVDGHRYTVELRLWGDALDPDLVTKETGLQPCQTRRTGQPIGTRRTYSTNMWAFNGESDEYGRNWESLEEGLTFVLNALAGFEHHFVRYRDEYRATWWCGHFQSSFDGGAVLSAPLLGRLAAFGVDLFIDNYFDQSEGADEGRGM